MKEKKLNILRKQKEAELNLLYILASKFGQNLDPTQLVDELIKRGLDDKTDGFWIWKVDTNFETYSPKFRQTLGFEGEEDFPNTPQSWIDAINPDHAQEALVAFEAHKEDPNAPYYLKVEYTKKNGEKVWLICAGTIVNRDNKDNILMLGTHEIIE